MEEKESMGSQIPRDWYFHFSFHLIMLAMALLSVAGLYLISLAKRGDLRLYFSALAFAFVGCTLLYLAKLPLYRQKRFFTFGPGELPAKQRRLYFVAYGVLTVAVALLLLFMIV